MTKSLNTLLLLVVLLNLSLGSYFLSQTLTEPAHYVWTISMTSDMMFMCAGSYDNKTYIYKNGNGGFMINQTLPFSNAVWSVHLTNDHQQLAIGLYNGSFFVFGFDNTTSSFTQKQALTFTNTWIRSVFITDDHLFMMAACYYARIVQIYHLNPSSYMFDINQTLTFGSSNV